MPWHERDYSREEFGGGGGRAGGWLGAQLGGASVVMWLLGINCAIHLLDAILGGGTRTSGVFGEPANYPWGPMHYWGSFNIAQGLFGGQVWRWVTYQFLHVNFLHLLVNMIGLFFFGPLMEQWWGSRRFLAFYLLCGIVGAVVMSLLTAVPGLLGVSAATGLIGASGSVFGILVGCAVAYPNQRVMLLIPPIPMTMRTLALVFLGISAFQLLAGANAGGQAAHLGGALLGFILMKRPAWLDWADRTRGGASLSGTVTQWKVKAAKGRWQKQQQQKQDEDREVDRILDKVKNHGLQSLSRHEKKVLNRATERKRTG